MSRTLGASGGRSAGSVTTEIVLAPTLTSHHYRNNGTDAPIALAFHATQDPISGHVSPALATEPGCIGVLSFDEQQITHPENRANPRHGDPAPTLAKTSRVDVLGEERPRRLTPREWERLQGFPDDYTLIDGADDTNRYAALGNSMAVPVMRWIGQRLLAVDELVKERAA